MASSHVGRKTAQERLRALKLDKARLARTEALAKLSLEEQEQVRKDAEGKTRAERWRTDVALYAMDRFGFPLTVQQVDLATKLVFGKKKFHARKAANKVGKTASAAIVVWWVAECHGYDHVHLLSSTGDNLEKILWAELLTLYERSQRSEFPLPESCSPPKDPTTGFSPFGCRVTGWTSVKVESLGGLSGAKQLFVVDEASSERFDILYDAIRRNTQSGETRWLAIGNPTRNTGAFHALFHGHPDAPLWDIGTMPAAEKDARTGEIRALYDFPGTGLSNPQTVAEWVAAAGEDSDSLRVGVFGEFPMTGSRAIYSYEWISQAVQRYEMLCDSRKNLDLEKAKPYLDEQLHVGVDVARFGEDDTVIYPRRGLLVLDPVVIHGKDTNEVSDAVVRCVDSWGRPGEVVKVKIDSTGSPGIFDVVHKVAKERLNAKAAAKHGGKKYLGVIISAIEVNVSRRATQTPTTADPGYCLLRDQLWFAGAAFLREGGIVKPNMRLQEDLLAPVYTYMVDGKKKVEPKEEIKKRLKRSPDQADAFCLSVYDGEPAIEYTGKVTNLPAPSWGSTIQTTWGDQDSRPFGV